MECNESYSITFLLSSSSSTTSMDKNLMIRWIIVMEYILYRWNIESSCSYIGDNKNGFAFFPFKTIQ